MARKELAAAAALVPTATARQAALAAVALLAVFTLLTAGAVARGATVPCHCFGAADAAPWGRGA